MINYYIENENKIIVFDTNKTKLQNTLNFMPQYQGLEIQETQRPLVLSEDGTEFVFADTPEYEQQQAQKEAQRIAMLNLTAADVERAIYKAKGLDFDDILTLVEAQPLAEDGTPQIDIKALKIELKANNFYRGSEWVITVGAMLGFTPKQLDLFFEDGNYEHLISSTEN